MPDLPVPEISVVAAGPQTTVQDQGRPGHAHLGCRGRGRSARPTGSSATARTPLGSSACPAALELGVDRALIVAVTGGLCEVTADVVAAGWGAPVTLRAGARFGSDR